MQALASGEKYQLKASAAEKNATESEKKLALSQVCVYTCVCV